MFHLALLLTLLFSLPSALAFEDPSGSLPQLDRLLGGTDFSQAFQAGDQFGVTRLSCVTGESSCSRLSARYVVLRADAGGAQVATYIASRPDPSSIAKIQRKDWSAISGNMARSVVREIESYGVKVTVGELRETSVTVTVNGKPETHPAYELSLRGKSGVGIPVEQRLTFSAFFRGPGQIVRREWLEGVGGPTVMELGSCTFSGR